MAFPLLTAEEQAELVARIASGDAAAESRIAELFSAPIQAMARVRSRGAVDPHDVCQEVLLAVITSLRRGQLRDAERLGPFVAGVSRNIINNQLRVQSKRSVEPLQDMDAVADLRDEMAQRDRARVVRSALEDVRGDDRRILVLSLVHGLKSGEVATRLGMDATVVRARKSRALRRLIERLRGI